MCESSKFIFVVPIQCVPFAAADDFATWITPVILKDDLVDASCRLDNFDDNVVDSQCLHWANEHRSVQQYSFAIYWV